MSSVDVPTALNFLSPPPSKQDTTMRDFDIISGCARNANFGTLISEGREREKEIILVDVPSALNFLIQDARREMLIYYWWMCQSYHIFFFHCE